ncbi:MAG: glycosyltransferase family 4 protein [Actinomycetota bacterium]|nr:glycosyltransferase family 4 protein [Actinomycetota bacterium]
MPLRVLFVNPSPVRGGAEEILIGICRGVDPGRIRPTVACLVDGPFPDDLEAAGIPVVRLRAGRLRQAVKWAATVRRLSSLARKHDLVVSWQVKGHFYGTPAAYLARRPAAWWDHGIRPRRGEPRYWPDGILPKLLPVVAVAADSHAAALPIPGAVGVHPGIDARPYIDAATERVAARDELGIRAADTAIGIVGRLQPWKGQHVFLRAAAHLAERPDTVFVVVGDAIGGFSATYPASLRALSADLGITDGVRFTGQRTDIPRVLAALDIFVHASAAEPFGIVIVEAMAAGKPVVATRGGGVDEIITDEVNGLLVDYEDDRGLAKAVERLLDDPALATRLAEAGRTIAVERFTPENMVEHATQFFERAARKGNP